MSRNSLHHKIKAPVILNRLRFDQFKLVKQFRAIPKYYKNVRFEGFDTETQDGYARVLCSSDSGIFVRGIDDVLGFLTNRRFRDTLNFFFNLAFDFEVMFKWDLDILEQLRTGSHAAKNGWEITYVKGKYLNIRDPSKHKWAFYDIAQFYLTSLAKAARQYLGMEPHELKGDRAVLFEKYSLNKIAEYCQHDALLTKLLAEEFYKSFEPYGIRPLKPISCGYLSQCFTLTHGRIPKFWDTSPTIQEMYWNAYRGGWFDTYKKGRFKAYHYDITSAYPHVLADLPDLRDGKWYSKYCENSPVGVVKCLATKTKSTVLPVAINLKGKNLYPLFDEPCIIYLTAREFKAYEKPFGLELLDAWSFKPKRNCRYPYRKIVKNLFGMKEKYRGQPGKYLVAKQIINSLYGKTAQKTPWQDKFKIGQLFNPVYAAEITAGTRLMIWDAAKRKADDVISILTDSIISTSKLKLNIGKELGDWKTEHSKHDCVVVQSGIYQFGSDKPKVRGLFRMCNLYEILDIDEQLVTVSWKRPLHYKECFMQNKPEKIGVFETITKKLDVAKDLKRIWRPKPVYARQLLHKEFNSIPVPFSLFSVCF